MRESLLVLQGAFSGGREALINALRHSHALHVEVEIAYHAEQFYLWGPRRLTRH